VCPPPALLESAEELYEPLSDASKSPLLLREMRPIVLASLVEVAANVETRFEGRALELLSLLGRMQSDPLTLPEDAEHGVLVCEALLRGYVVVVELLERCWLFDRELVLRNVKQLIKAVQIAVRQSFLSAPVIDLALKLLWCLLKAGRHEFAVGIPGSVAGQAVDELFAIVRESGHTGMIARAERFERELALCLRRGF
jgi:hypothetical protein